MLLPEVRPVCTRFPCGHGAVTSLAVAERPPTPLTIDALRAQLEQENA